MKTCPYCAEDIAADATVCPYCDSKLRGGRKRSSGGATGRYADYAPPERESRRSSRRSSSRSSGGKKKSNNTLVIVLVSVGAVVILGFCGAALFLPAVSGAREAARRSQCKNNLKQIGIALHNYHNVHGSFPPAVVLDANGRALYSWRVLLLPFLEETALYRQLDLTKPWNDPRNRQLLDRMPLVFGCPSHPQGMGNTTHYVAAFGKDCVLGTGKPTRFRDITDGTLNTAMVGESTGVLVHWAAPGDIDIDLNTNLRGADGFTSGHSGGSHFLFADGSVKFIPDSVDDRQLRSMFVINDAGGGR